MTFSIFNAAYTFNQLIIRKGSTQHQQYSFTIILLYILRMYVEIYCYIILPICQPRSLEMYCSIILTLFLVERKENLDILFFRSLMK